MSNFKYREASKEDEEQLRNLGLLSYGQFKDDLPQENWANLKAALSVHYLYSGILKIATGFVCEADEKIIGMAFLIPSGNPTEIFQSDWSYIRLVGVDPDYAGKGIGKHLMHMCIDLARRNNEKVIALHTSEFMNAARHIYENMGFVQLRELPTRYGKRYWLYKIEL
jgi:GNAT superfamily N-acetyltransferase